MSSICLRSSRLLDMFDFIGTQLAECDREIEGQLQTLQAHEGEPAKGKKRGRTRNASKFDLRTQLIRMGGVDLTRIDGIDVTELHHQTFLVAKKPQSHINF